MSRAHALVAAAALLGCGKQPEPASAPAIAASAPSANEPSAAPQTAPSASSEPSAVASAAPSVAPSPLASASVVAIAPPTSNSGPIGPHFGTAAAYGGPPPPADGTIIKGPKSVTNVASVTGGAADAQSVVRKNAWRFKACHNKSLAQDPSSAGKVTVAVKVDAEGAVVDATASSTTAPAYLTSCVVAGAKSMKFPPTGKPQTLTFALTFATAD
jgi:hypothetical protein